MLLVRFSQSFIPPNLNVLCQVTRLYFGIYRLVISGIVSMNLTVNFEHAIQGTKNSRVCCICLCVCTNYLNYTIHYICTYKS